MRRGFDGEEEQLTHAQPFEHLMEDNDDEEDGELFACDGEGEADDY